jgi:hypothetical protein
MNDWLSQQGFLDVVVPTLRELRDALAHDLATCGPAPQQLPSVRRVSGSNHYRTEDGYILYRGVELGTVPPVRRWIVVLPDGTEYYGGRTLQLTLEMLHSYAQFNAPPALFFTPAS